MDLAVFDLHCDTASALAGTGKLRRNSLHMDLTRAAALGAYAQCFACFTTTDEGILQGRTPEADFQMQLHTILTQLEENRDLIRQAFTAEDVTANRTAGKMSAILTIEGPAGFGYDPERLEELCGLGFRISTLGWNEPNCLIGSHVTGGGLTDRGRAYVRQCQQLGMLVDVSHCSDEGFWDILKITQAPVIASHSNSRSRWPHSRNLTDDMFLAICQTGGVAGINLYSRFLGEKPTLDTVCDHIFHFLELDPTGKHIALGGDLDGCDSLPEGFSGVQSYPALARRLLDRGLGETLLQAIYWNNAMGVMESAVRHNQKSK